MACIITTQIGITCYLTVLVLIYLCEFHPPLNSPWASVFNLDRQTFKLPLSQFAGKTTTFVSPADDTTM